MENIKTQAKKVIDTMPDSVGWDDVIYEFYVRAKIQAGIDAADATITCANSHCVLVPSSWISATAPSIFSLNTGSPLIGPLPATVSNRR